MNFYTYAYLRPDRTPYYIGKGTGERIWCKHNVPNPPRDRIIFLKQNLSEEDAFKHERYMIAVFGRKDNNTGILRNLTDGGEGATGRVPTKEQIEKQRDKMLGRKPAPITSEGREKRSKIMIGNTRGSANKGKSKYIVFCKELKMEWKSVIIAAEYLGTTKSAIYSAILNRNGKWRGLTLGFRENSTSVGER